MSQRPAAYAALAIASLLVVFAAPPIAAEHGTPTTGMQPVTVGPVSIRVPKSWQRREGPADDNPHYDAPGPNPGLGPSVAIAIDDVPSYPDAEETGTRRLKIEHRTIAGRSAEVRHWLFEEGDSRGVTIILKDVVPGKRVQVSGWAPARQWNKRGDEVWGILDTLSIAGVPAQPAQPSDEMPAAALESFEIGNIAAVTNGPTAATVFKVATPIRLRSIRTYHWNKGRGAKPGTISLRGPDGRVLGPWPTRGLPGQGGVANAYWLAEVDERIEPGSYTVSTSNDATWATNEQAKRRGFYRIEWQELAAAPAPTASVEPQAQSGPVGGSPAAGDTMTDPAGPGPATGEQALFDGTLVPRWGELALAGGDFKSFARSEGGILVIDVPENNGWGKTGIWSPEPLVPASDAANPTQRTLKFRFDPARTNSFVLALSSRAHPDEWGAHDARVAWSVAEDGQSSRLTLWIRQVEIMSARLGPAAPAELALSLSPDGSIEAGVSSGERVTAVMPQDAAAKALHVYALAHAPGAQKPARMGLRTIGLAQAPLPPPTAAADPAAVLRSAQRVDLFDGRLGTRWLAHNAHGGLFAEHAVLRGGDLVVDVPPGSAWGKVGIFTPEPVVWLDDFRESASVKLSFRFDPQRTTGFVIALAAPGWGNVGGNDPGQPAMFLHWRRTAAGAGARVSLSVLPQYGAPIYDVALLDGAPGEVRLVLSPQGLRVEAEGWPDRLTPWGLLQPGQGLRVWVYSHPDEAQQPVKMALRGIALERTPGPPQAPAEPEAGVAPLPMKVLFHGREGPVWEPIGVAGGDFAKFARWGTGRLVIDVPPGNSWGKTGLLSAGPIVQLDERLDKTPFRLDLKVDARATSGLAFAIGTERQADMWPTNRLWVYLVRQDAGRFVLGLHRSGSQSWSRPLPADFVTGAWDGTLQVSLGRGWTSIALPGGPLVRAPTGFEGGAALYASIVSHPAREHEASSLALEGVTAQWLTPAGMTAAERWSLLDPSEFDASGFLVDLARDVTSERGTWGEMGGGEGAEAGASGAGISADDAPLFLDAPAVQAPAPSGTERDTREDAGSLLDGLLRLSPIAGAYAAAGDAPDCSKVIEDHIDEARRIEITLGEQADVGGALVNLGLTVLGKAKFEDDTARETLRNIADRAVNAWQDGQAIGEDWNADRTQDMVMHFMQATLKIGLTSDALGDDRTFRDVKRTVRDTWAKALKNLPEDRARALVAELSRAVKPAIPDHELYKDLLDKGKDVDFGSVFGQGAEGEGRALLWTLTNNTLATFSPHYAIGKEVAATVLEAAKAAKAWAVNDRVTAMYRAWKQEMADGGGAEAKAFYDARTLIGDRLPLTETKNLMRKDPDQPISDAAAEQFLFRQFAAWYKAEQAATQTGDRLVRANDAFSALSCRPALDRKIGATGDACQRELEAFKRYADLDAQIRGRLESWMKPGNRCNNQAIIDGEVGFLMCQLLEWGEDSYKKALGKRLEDCGLLDYGKVRSDAAGRVTKRLSKLTDERLKALLDRAGVTAPAEFLNCLCQDGHGFHYYSGPDAGGSCRRIGPLGGATWSGFRVKDWSACAKAYPLGDGRTVIDAVADTLIGIRIDQK